MRTSSAEPSSGPADSRSVGGARPEPYLVATAIEAGYTVPVLRDVSLQVGLGEIVTVVGPNGSGKSTLLKAVMSLIRITAGTVALDGTDITNLSPEAIVRAGVGYVPQEREVFPSLSVLENLEVGAYGMPRCDLPGVLERVTETFPQLSSMLTRQAGTLSGGERKIVAIGRALMRLPRLLVLDEPTAGLSPTLSEVLLERDVVAAARAGTSVLMVEQKAKAALTISGWGYMLVRGELRLGARGPELGARDDLGKLFLGIDAADTPLESA